MFIFVLTKVSAYEAVSMVLGDTPERVVEFVTCFIYGEKTFRCPFWLVRKAESTMITPTSGAMLMVLPYAGRQEKNGSLAQAVCSERKG